MLIRFVSGTAIRSEALLTRARRGLARAMRPASGRVRDVVIRVRDRSRAKRVEKECRIVAHVDGVGTVAVEGRSGDYHAAVASAAAKLRRALTHRLRRA